MDGRDVGDYLRERDEAAELAADYALEQEKERRGMAEPVPVPNEPDDRPWPLPDEEPPGADENDMTDARGRAPMWSAPVDLADALNWAEQLRSTFDDGSTTWTEDDEDFLQALIDTVHAPGPDWGACPHCGGEDLTSSDWDWWEDGNGQEVTCRDCGRTWREVYTAHHREGLDGSLLDARGRAPEEGADPWAPGDAITRGREVFEAIFSPLTEKARAITHQPHQPREPEAVREPAHPADPEHLDFAPLHAWMKAHDAAGTIFTPADVETLYELTAEQTGRPFDEVWPELRRTWEWRKGLTEALTERGWSILAGMVESFVAEGLHASLEEQAEARREADALRQWEMREGK